VGQAGGRLYGIHDQGTSLNGHWVWLKFGWRQMLKKQIFPIFHLVILCLLALNLMSGCQPGQVSGLPSTPTLASSNRPASASALTPASTLTPPTTSNLSLPIGIGTPIPLSQPVGEVNINQIQLLASIPEDPERIYRISSDNRLLFIADTHGIDVFDISTKTFIKHLPFGVTYNAFSYATDPSGINESHFSISASGNVLAIIDFEGVKVISLEGRLLFSSALEMPFSPNSSPRVVTSGNSLALSPDGEYLAFYRSTNGIDVIQLSDGKTLDTPDLVGNFPRFSPGGKTLVTMNNNHLEFWNTADWTKTQDINYRGYWPLFTFVSDSTILLHNWSNSLELWDFIHHKRIRTINLEGDPQESIILAQPLMSPNGGLLAVLKRDAGMPCFELSPVTVTVFNLNGEKLSDQTTPFRSGNCRPYFLGLAYISSPIFLMDNGEAIAVLPPSSDDQWGTTLLELDISFAQKILPPEVESYLQRNWKDFDYDFETSPDGRFVALSLRKGTGSSMVIYDVSEDKPLYWGGVSYTLGCFSRDGTLFVRNLGDTIKMIDLSSSQELESVTVYEDQRLVPYARMAFSPDHAVLAAVIAKDAMSETVGFIRINDGTLIYQWPVGNDEIKNLRFSEDGRYLIISTYSGWIDILGIYP
jgi:hypothetical protein